ncbi:MAG TPA: AAA family ATPase [Candidatus Saccharimonadales bacterium]|nr:AAA family ATPase [Candidatus Saccharimonadales bacterium]
MIGRRSSPTLIGRDDDLRAVAQHLDAAIAGTPSHLLIAGEAGIGKSRLVLEAARLAELRGMRVVSGGCANVGEGGLPYGPFVEILRGLARDVDEPVLAAAAGPARADLARLVPAMGTSDDSVATMPTGTYQARLFDAVLGLVQRLAADAPLLLVIEDLHWADPATRDLVAFLVRHVRVDPVLIVLTFRSDELHRRHPLLPWLAEVGRSGRVDRLDLERLDATATADLLASILDDAPSAEAVDRIHRRSDGNPFFVEELLMAGQDGGLGRLPPTLRQVLLARIAALPDDAQTVVGVAAVAGRHVDHALLARVAGMDDDALLAALRTAVGSQVLVTGPEVGGATDGYAFRHALLQEAAYDELLPGERQRLHRAFAEALDARLPGSGAVEAGHWAELAHHWSSAREERRAFDASIRAGTAAAGAFAFADARRHDERALEQWATIEDPEAIAGFDRVTLLDRAAVAAWLSGEAHRGVDLRREAVASVDAATDPVRAGVMLERLGRILWNNAESEAALVACEAAVAAIPAEPPTAERARVLAGFGQLLMLLDRWEESTALCEEAIEIAVRVGARQAEGHARNTLGLDYSAAGRCAEAVASLQAAVRIAHEIGDPDDLGRAYVNLGEAMRECGDARGALTIVHEGFAVADGVGITRTYGAFIRENGIMIAYDLGEWAEAARLADDSAAADQTARNAERYLLSHWVPLLVGMGDERAPAKLEELRSMLDGYPVETQFNAPCRMADAEAALWRGAPAEALEVAQLGIDELETTRFHRYHLRLFRFGLRAAADLAEIGRARRDHAAEREAIAAGERLAGDFAVILERWLARQHGKDRDETDAEASLVAAELERVHGRPGVEAWRTAVERYGACEQPYVVAYARWREGEALLAGGERTGATAAISEAWAIADRLGARPLRSALDALVARARIDRPAVVVVGDARRAQDEGTTAPSDTATDGAGTAAAFGLTRRELDVLPLMIQGRTNRQIAETLFISESTAGVHVSNIIGKLGATSRTEAATIAVRIGLD